MADENIWKCKVGGPIENLPPGSDGSMRAAVTRAFREVTGYSPHFLFSGWAAELTEPERAVVENRLPLVPHPDVLREFEAYAAHLITTACEWGRDGGETPLRVSQALAELRGFFFRQPASENTDNPNV